MAYYPEFDPEKKKENEQGTAYRFYDEKEQALLAQVLPNVAAHLRDSMANVYAMANRIASPESREKNPKLDQQAAILTMSSFQMLRLVGNLAEAGELNKPAYYEMRNGDIVALCKKICERAEQPFSLKGVHLEFRSDKTGHIIAMNEEKLERLFLNLLSNALKFTPAGGTVTVWVRTSDRFVRISVQDTGRGIAEDRLDTIFERYLQPDDLAPPPHGLGLGLPISRHIAQGHGGNIMVESKLGEGSTFVVSLLNKKDERPVMRDSARFDYAGGMNHTLLELSDALTPEAFYQKHLD